MEFSTFPFVVEALGYNRSIREDLDKLYQTDKFRFYELARNHELYDHPIVKEGGLLQEEYSKKALGIVLASEADAEVHQALSDLIISGWKRVFVYVRNRSSLKLGDFIRYYFRKNGGIEHISDDSLNTNLLMALVIAVSLEKPVAHDDSYQVLVQMFSKRWDFYNYPSSRISLDLVTEEERVRIGQLLDEVGSFSTYCAFLDRFKERAEIPAFLFDFEGLSSASVFDDLTYSRRDLEEIVYAYLSVEEILGNTSLFEQSFCYMLVIRSLLRAYNQVKEHYFANNKETMFWDFQRLEKEKAELSRRLSVSEDLLSKSASAVDSLKRDVKRLSEKVIELESDRSELVSLREFVFSLDLENEFSPSGVEVDLSAVNGVVLGGHVRWQNKMKSLLPSFSFISPESLNFDQNLIRNADFIFVFVNYLNHAIYYRAMGAVTTAKVHFLRQANDDLVLEEIKKVVNG